MLSMTARDKYRKAVSRLKAQGFETSEEMIAMLEHDLEKEKELRTLAVKDFKDLKKEHEKLQDDYWTLKDNFWKLHTAAKAILNIDRVAVEKKNEMIELYMKSIKPMGEEK